MGTNRAARENSNVPLQLICILLGQNIPPVLSQKLASQWGGKTTVKIYPGEDHGLLMHENSSWEDIAVFLGGL